MELPVLPGRPVRRAEPGPREHDPAQARLDLPAVGARDRGDPARGRRTGRRLREHVRVEPADPRDPRRPADRRGLADRQRAGRHLGRGRGREEPQEDRARTRRLRPADHPRHRRPGRDRQRHRDRADAELRPVLQRPEADDRAGRSVRRVRRPADQARHGVLRSRRPVRSRDEAPAARLGRRRGRGRRAGREGGRARRDPARRRSPDHARRVPRGDRPHRRHAGDGRVLRRDLRAGRDRLRSSG